MPKNKDLKKLIRARMGKTGESYTAARAQILGRQDLPLPSDYETLAGQTDETVRTRTGKTWPEWCRVLDELGATEMDHPEIAKWVNAQIDDFWWAQTVTIGYERLSGRRQPGQTCDGDFQASKSKTVGAPQATTFGLLLELAGDPGWLAGLTLHGSSEPKSVRFRGADGSHASVWLADKDRKCSVSVNHTKLASPEARDAAKEEWGTRLSPSQSAPGPDQSSPKQRRRPGVPGRRRTLGEESGLLRGACVEAEEAAAEPDLVAVPQPDRADAPAVHERAVRAVEVPQVHLGRVEHLDDAVPPGDVRVPHHEVRVQASHQDALLVEATHGALVRPLDDLEGDLHRRALRQARDAATGGRARLEVAGRLVGSRLVDDVLGHIDGAELIPNLLGFGPREGPAARDVGQRQIAVRALGQKIGWPGLLLVVDSRGLELHPRLPDAKLRAVAQASLQLHLLVDEDAVRGPEVHDVPATPLVGDDRVDGGDLLVRDDQITDLPADHGPALLEGEPVSLPLPVQEHELSFRLQGMASGSPASAPPSCGRGWQGL